MKFAEAGRECALIRYEKTIQTAFTVTSDALIAHQRVRERREKQAALVATLENRLRLAYLRYRGVVDTQLNALDADRDLFQAELDLARIPLEELLTVVQVYKARAEAGSSGSWTSGLYSFKYPFPTPSTGARRAALRTQGKRGYSAPPLYPRRACCG